MANPFATGGRAKVLIAEETTFGVIPATPQMIELPKSALTLEPNIEQIEDDTLTSDLMGQETRNGNYNLAGDLTASLRHNQFDVPLEATLGGTWTSNVLKAGVTERSYVVEKQYLDIDEFDRYRGVRFAGMSLSMDQGQIVKASYQMMGAGFESAATALDATPTATLSAKRAMSHVGGAVSIDGTPVVATAASLNFSRGLEYAYGIGSSEAFDIAARRLTCNGALTLYFKDNTERDLWLSEDRVPISFLVSDGTNTMTFLVPYAKLTAVARPVSGEGFIFQNVTFVGEKDPTLATILQITRTAA